MSTISYRRFAVIQVVPPKIGRLFGTTKIAGTPDAPTRRRVQVVLADSNAHGLAFPAPAESSTWTWAHENGNWEVRNLDPARKYHAIAYDHTGQYDPVVKMNLIPTVD